MAVNGKILIGSVQNYINYTFFYNTVIFGVLLNGFLVGIYGTEFLRMYDVISSCTETDRHFKSGNIVSKIVLKAQ